MRQLESPLKAALTAARRVLDVTPPSAEILPFRPTPHLIPNDDTGMAAIHQKMIASEPLSREDWRYLAFKAKYAYVAGARDQHSFVSSRIADLIRAFRAVIRLRDAAYPGEEFTDDYRYINRLPCDKDVPRQARWLEDVDSAASRTIAWLERTPTTPVCADVLAENLLEALQCEPELNQTLLNRALYPYLHTLFHCAAREIAQKHNDWRDWASVWDSDQPNPDRDNYLKILDNAPLSNTFEDGNFSLETIHEGVYFSSRLLCRSTKLWLDLSHVKLEQFISSFLDGVKIRSLVECNDSVTFRTGAAFVSFNKEQCEQIEAVLRQYLADPVESERREVLQLRWGVI